MWNSEARNSSPIVFTFMSSWERPKTPPPPGRRDKTELVEESRCWTGLDELEPEPWVSLWNNHFGEESTRLDGRERDAACAAWKEGTKGYPSDQIHCGGGARSGTRRGRGKIVASEDFASFPICVFVRSSFSPLGFFRSSALPGICVHFQFFGRCRMGVCL
jgi:hypothetical protein